MVRSEQSIMRLPTLTIRPPSRLGSTRVASVTSLPTEAFSVVFSSATCASFSATALVTSAVDFAALLGGERAEALDHVGDREQAAVARRSA